MIRMRSTFLRPAFVLFVLAGALEASAAIEPAEYAARRQRVAEAIGPHAMLVVRSPAPAIRNGDTEWPFRQSDDLYYLTGVDAPDTTLVLMPGEREHREILFALDRDPSQEVWTGRIADHAELAKSSGVDEVVSESKFDAFLAAAFEGRGWADPATYRYYAKPGLPAFHRSVREGKAEVYLLLDRRTGSEDEPPSAVSLLSQKIRSRYPEVRVRDASSIVSGLREVKSAAEIALIQRAVDVTLEAQKAAMRRALAASHEYQVQATVEFTFRDLGAAGWGYPSIVAAGPNATTLHYVTNDAKIPRDGLLLLDVGAEVEHYTADVTHTFPADGTFSDEQEAIYEAVLRTNQALMPLFRPGSSLRAAHEKALDLIGKELAALGLVTKAEDRDQVKLYFMHGLGHPLGLAVHDAFDRARPFEPGMVATNEPGIYVRAADVRASDVWKRLSEAERAGIDAALAKYDGIGVRIEDDVLVTQQGPRVLSAALPRTVEEIEKFMAEAAGDAVR